jgi:hypothetical protein
MNLKELRGDLSLRDAAKLLDISAAYLCRCETGRIDSPPSEEVIGRMSQTYAADFDELCCHFGRVPSDIERLILSSLSLLKSLRKRC